MAFKMKGPGLPGFRKQQGTGFYKMNPLNSKRSPMLQGEDDSESSGNWDEHGYSDAEISKMQKEYMDLSEEERKAIPFDQFFYKNYTERQGDQVRKIKETLKIANIPGDKDDDYDGSGGYMPDDEWKAWLETDPGKKYLKKYGPKQVAVKDIDIEEINIKPKDDVEMTNFRIDLARIGIGTHTVKTDAGDGSYRYRASASGELNHVGTGQLSAGDIHKGVLEGKWKYEVLPGGRATGNLLMSKDYYENVHKPMEEMYARGAENMNAHVAKVKDITSSRTRNAWVKQKMAEEYPEIKEKSWFKDIFDGKRNDGVTKQYADKRNELARQYMDEHKFYYDEKKNGYQSTYEDPANFGHVMPKILPDDEGYKHHRIAQVVRPQDYMYNEEEGKYVLKPNALTLDPQVFKNLSSEEQREHNAALDARDRQHSNFKEMNWEGPPTPSHYADASIMEYNNMTDAEKNSEEGRELYKDLLYMTATKQEVKKNDLDFRKKGNIDTDFIAESTNIENIEIDDDGNVIR